MKKISWGVSFLLLSACLPDGPYGDLPADIGVDLGVSDDSGVVDDSGVIADSGVVVDSGVVADAGVIVADAGLAEYAHVPPPSGTVPEALRGQRWLDHFEDDLLPYWTMTEALGTPEGNFPTFRGFNGSIQGSTERRPRMLGRQTFFYSVAYLLTGTPRYLELAKAGADWTIAHARDDAIGGWHELLNMDGSPRGSGPKLAQDTSYAVQGLAAYYFVTRDPAVEDILLETRDLLFDPLTYWDDANQRIKDGLNADLSAEVDAEGDGGWELVAQLDPINAFMMIVQPVLSEASRRQQFLDDIERLVEVMIERFFEDGIFWGVHTLKGQYRTRHVDFGHTLKSYWMILQLDKRLPDHPYQSFLNEHVHTWVTRAYDMPNGRWAKRPTSATANEYGSDWWIYAEADQIAATLNLLDYRYSDELAETAAHWLTDYVDPTFKEIIPGITRTGQKVFNWPATDTAKCNQWKNGFHSAEHALIMYLLGNNLENRESVLHFAVPAAIAGDFPATPYLFQGREVSRTPGTPITIDGADLTPVTVRFDQLY